MMWGGRRCPHFGRTPTTHGARGHFRRAPWSGDFRRPNLAARKKRASDVSKYLSTYARVEKIAKSREKNVTTSKMVLNLYVGSYFANKPIGASPGRNYEDGISTKNLVLNILYGVE